MENSSKFPSCRVTRGPLSRSMARTFRGNCHARRVVQTENHHATTRLIRRSKECPVRYLHGRSAIVFGWTMRAPRVRWQYVESCSSLELIDNLQHAVECALVKARSSDRASRVLSMLRENGAMEVHDVANDALLSQNLANELTWMLCVDGHIAVEALSARGDYHCTSTTYLFKVSL